MPSLGPKKKKNNLECNISVFVVCELLSALIAFLLWCTHKVFQHFHSLPSHLGKYPNPQKLTFGLFNEDESREFIQAQGNTNVIN